MKLQVNKDKNRVNKISIKSAKRKKIKKKPHRRINNNHIKWKN